MSSVGGHIRSLAGCEAALAECRSELALRAGPEGWECGAEWKPVRPIPEEDAWFENVWAEYREGKTFS